MPVAAPCAQYVPAAHGLLVPVTLPVAVQKPGAHTDAEGDEVEDPLGQKKPTAHTCEDGHAAVRLIWPTSAP